LNKLLYILVYILYAVLKIELYHLSHTPHLFAFSLFFR
jgi:hypothetical protein